MDWGRRGRLCAEERLLPTGREGLGEFGGHGRTGAQLLLMLYSFYVGQEARQSSAGVGVVTSLRN